MRTYVYIDGFNFFYGSIKGTGFKWLDIRAFAAALLPDDDVACVRYFTAKDVDPKSKQRQEVYWRALRANGVKIFEGTYRMREKKGRLLVPDPSHLGNERPHKDRVTISAPEEKGSDVNLASWLLLDASRDKFESAVVVSNDSDLKEPVRMVRHEFKLKVGVVNPRHGKSPKQIDGDFHPRITDKLLAAHQFPNPVVVKGKELHKPSGW